MRFVLGNKQDAIAAYLAGDGVNAKKDLEAVYCPELGLAIEKLRPGFTIESLWNVIPPSWLIS